MYTVLAYILNTKPISNLRWTARTNFLDYHLVLYTLKHLYSVSPLITFLLGSVQPEIRLHCYYVVATQMWGSAGSSLLSGIDFERESLLMDTVLQQHKTTEHFPTTYFSKVFLCCRVRTPKTNTQHFKMLCETGPCRVKLVKCYWWQRCALICSSKPAWMIQAAISVEREIHRIDRPHRILLKLSVQLSLVLEPFGLLFGPSAGVRFYVGNGGIHSESAFTEL